MPKAYHETLKPSGNLGIQYNINYIRNPHIPLHWHEPMEIICCLNGNVTVHVGNEEIQLSRKQIIVFDSREVHSIHADSTFYVFLCIHIDKRQLSVYSPDLEFYHIKCRPLPPNDPNYQHYEHLCQLALDLILESQEFENTFHMRADGTALLMMAELMQYFSVYTPPLGASEQKKPNDTIREIITYVNEHYQKNITLDDMSERTGFSKEYFCRFFKQYMGITFLRYLNEVRISHAGTLLSTTDLPISDILLECGFTNQTLFNRLFKEIYGMTPRQARKNKTEDKTENKPL